MVTPTLLCTQIDQQLAQYGWLIRYLGLNVETEIQILKWIYREASNNNAAQEGTCCLGELQTKPSKQ